MQSMMFSKALTNKGALFKQQIYPDEGHNLAGVKKHLHRSMTLFFDDCFKKQVSESDSVAVTKRSKSDFFSLKVPLEVKAGLGNGGASSEQSN